MSKVEKTEEQEMANVLKTIAVLRELEELTKKMK